MGFLGDAMGCLEGVVRVSLGTFGVSWSLGAMWVSWECLLCVIVSLVANITMHCGCYGSALGIIPLGCHGGEWRNIKVSSWWCHEGALWTKIDCQNDKRPCVDGDVMDDDACCGDDGDGLARSE